IDGVGLSLVSVAEPLDPHTLAADWEAARVHPVGVVANDFYRVVRRAAIHDEVLDLELALLRYHAFDGVFNVSALVERRRNDAELRKLHCEFQVRDKRAEKPLIVRS